MSAERQVMTMLKKPKILVVGSFVMDLIATTSRIPRAGESVIGLGFSSAPGGKGANQAVQCARLGADVTMVGSVGADAFGREMLAAVSAAGVDVSHVLINENESSGVGHIEIEKTESGVQNRIIVCPGANMRFTPDDISWVKEHVSEFDMVMLQFEIPMEADLAVARWAGEAGVPVMVNPAPAAPIPEELYPLVSYLSPNETEAAALSGQSIRAEGGVNREDLLKVAEIMTKRGVKKLIVTLGENGSCVADGRTLELVDRVKMEQVADPTAAGDSFVASFCTALAAGLSEKNALVFASHAAAITVCGMGAIPSLPGMEQVQALLRERGCDAFDPAGLDVLKNG